MGVFTFVCRSSGDEWSAKQLSGDLEASASSSYELQRRLVQAAVSADTSGGVQSSFSLVTPSSAVFQKPQLLTFTSTTPRGIWYGDREGAACMRCGAHLDRERYEVLAIAINYLQVIIGGGGGGAFIGAASAGGAAGSAGGGGGGGAAAEAPPAEEKKEEKEESDDDMGFSLFD
uniref:60S acidic ribosomal protein P3 n=1 Tax=Ananas comosus var. bracteatus TaxID=296719 RepID=A0A6V7P2K7_ANACO|nr:unnamed protein product [Ananas comosus var. bracteatus]